METNPIQNRAHGSSDIECAYPKELKVGREFELKACVCAYESWRGLLGSKVAGTAILWALKNLAGVGGDKRRAVP